MVKIWIAVFIGLAATADDLVRRRISNWIPAVACLAGIALQATANGWRGSLSALLGTLTGGAVFLIFYLLGGMGGGDVKLMAGFGAILGARGILEASLWTAACGGVLAVLVILGNAVRRAWRTNRAPQSAVTQETAPSSAADSIPYAPAIAAGVWLSLVANF